MSEREIPPIKVEQTEISDHLLGRGAKVTRTVEISDDSGTVWGYKIWYENAAGESLTLLLERAGLQRRQKYFAERHERGQRYTASYPQQRSTYAKWHCF